jgi:hypothetical protein
MTTRDANSLNKLVHRSRTEGVDLIGPGGLLTGLSGLGSGGVSQSGVRSR